MTTTKIPDSYTPDDIAAAERIRVWLDKSTPDLPKRTLAALARSAGMSAPLAHQVVNCEYVSPPTVHLHAILDAIHSQEARIQAGVRQIPFVETSVYRIAEAVCNRAREFANEDDVGVLFGRVGVGKTTALKEYCRRNPGAIYLRAFAQMNASVLLNRLVDAVRANVRRQSGGKWSRGTNQEKLDAVINRLAGTEQMLIIDETTRLSPGCIEILRDIADDAQVGLVLAGRETLEPMIQDEEGRFGEIASRVGYWPPVIIAITQDDTRLLVDAYWGQTIDGETHSMFWETTCGSARALSKLMASTRKYCRKKTAVPTPKIVSDIWRNTMRPKRMRAYK